MQKLTILGRLPSLNELVAANRTSKYKGAKLKSETEDFISSYIRLQGLIPVDVPVEIIIRYYEPNTRRDIDNVLSGNKYILDALVKQGILQNDNQKHVKNLIPVYMGVDRDDPRVEVDIYEQGEIIQHGAFSGADFIRFP